MIQVSAAQMLSQGGNNGIGTGTGANTGFNSSHSRALGYTQMGMHEVHTALMVR